MQYTKRYELLNYSDHGTIVDNILYSCDYAKRSLSINNKKSDYSLRAKDDSTVEEIKKIANKKVSTVVGHSVERTKRIDCKCNVNKQSNLSEVRNEEGWEGSAIIDHGSIVTFGCIPFLFSMINAQWN